MNLKYSVITGSALAVVFALNVSSSSPEAKSDLIDKSYLACLWHPYCKDPDAYSPILQPKGDKTETQDTKDEKLA